MEINFIVILLWSVSILILGVSSIVRINGTGLSSKLFSSSILIVAIWVASVGLLDGIKNDEYAIYVIRLNYYLGNIIANLFYILSTTFPNNKKISQKSILLFSTFQLLMLYLFIFTDLIIPDIYKIDGNFEWIWKFGKISIIFEFAFILFFALGINNFVNEYKKSNSQLSKKNILLMLLTITTGSIPATFLCIILPRMGIFYLNWLGAFLEVVWVPVIMYSIVKYRQMNVVNIMGITLTVLFAITFIISLLIDFTGFYYIKLFVLVLSALIIYYLILTIKKDYSRSEYLKSKNGILSRIIEYQTIEIRKAYTIENKARRDLERLNETKDQFILMTQHNLRTPITTIKYELGELINGKNGYIDDRAKFSLVRASNSAFRLSQIVDDFLNITTLKSNSQILKISKGSVKDIIDNIIHELRLDIEAMKLEVSYTKINNVWPEIKMDINKIKEALSIVIENSVKYNFYKGFVKISNKIKDDNLVLEIENTGVGITPEERSNLFEKIFYRSKRAREKNPIGMGIGLQVAKAIITGHKGQISIDSYGENYGARVEIILPID